MILVATLLLGAGLRPSNSVQVNERFLVVIQNVAVDIYGVGCSGFIGHHDAAPADERASALANDCPAHQT
ncbi:MAG: hypothetical protein ABJP33_20780 [Pseudoruegeria sp.]